MSGNITNWVSGDANKQQVEVAQIVLAKIKKKRYSKKQKYKLIKTNDHPATYKEVLVVGEEECDECEVLEDEVIECTTVEPFREEIISASLRIENVDLGLGMGTLEINIHD